MRQTITQQNSMGCGAACVAFAANVTYEQAVNVLGQDKARTVGFQLKELVDALKQYGLDYQFKYIKAHVEPLIYQEGAIVFIKRSAKYPYGHYLIRHNRQWADSWINLVLDKDLNHAQSGYRKRLPGTAQWAVLPTNIIK